MAQNKLETAKEQAEYAEAMARKERAQLTLKSIRTQKKILEKAARPTGLGRRGREPALNIDATFDGNGSAPIGGYSTRWDRTRPDGGRGRGGSAQSWLTWSARRAMRIDCQRLDRQNPLARALVSRSADLASFGFTVQANSEDPDWNTAAERWFNEWSRRTGFEALGGRGPDLTGQKTLAGMVHEIDRIMHVEGDIGGVFLDEGSIQMIEGERILNPSNAVDNETMRGGVETDDVGRPIRYYVTDWFPAAGGTFPKIESAYSVDAENFVLMVNPARGRFGSTRGEPSLAAVVNRFEHLDDTSEAVRLAYYVAACHAAIISTPTPGLDQGLSPGENVSFDDGLSERHEYIQPGTMRYIGPGRTITQIQGQHPNTGYDTLRMAEVTDIAADAGLPVVLFLLDYTKVNFSSAKAAVISAWRGLRRRQQYLIDTFLSRVYRWRIAMAIRRGEIDGYPAGYVPDGWERHTWTAPPPPVLDVLVEAQAAALLDQAKLKSVDRIMAETWGIDSDSEFQQMATETKQRREMEILPMGQPGATDPNAQQDGKNAAETDPGNQ